MHAFNTALFDANDKVIVVAGGGGKSTLIERLAENCKSAAKSVIVCSHYSMYPPPETNIFISADSNEIGSQLKDELKKSQIVYLGKRLENNKIKGFTVEDIRKNIVNLQADHIFIEADQTDGRPLSGFDYFNISAGKEIQRCIIVIGADCLNKTNDNTRLKTSDEFWQLKSIIDPVDLATWLLGHPRLQNLLKHNIPISVYINKVEDIFHKNMAITLARQLKIGGIERLVYGSIFNAEFKVIK